MKVSIHPLRRMRPSGLLSIGLLCLLISLMLLSPAWAHHVLGRPAYSLNEDSNTPPTMQLETQIGQYLVTMMLFPAFPKVGEEGRVRFYATHLDTGDPFLGEVQFSVQDDVWWGGVEETLGQQSPLDGIYRQAMLFSKEGDYLVSAHFEAGGEPYVIDLPVRIGTPASILPLIMTFGVLGMVVLALALKKRALKKNREERSERVANQRLSSDE